MYYYARDFSLFTSERTHGVYKYTRCWRPSSCIRIGQSRKELLSTIPAICTLSLSPKNLGRNFYADVVPGQHLAPLAADYHFFFFFNFD